MKLRARSLVILCVLFAMAASGCTRAATRKQQYLTSGNEYFGQAKFREAVIQFRNAVRVDPQSGEARTRLADSYVRLGEGGNALEEYVRAADLLGADFDAQMRAARILVAARRWDDAVARADAALKIQPNSVDAHLLRGNALAGQKDLDQALTEVEEAIRLQPTLGTSYTQLGFVKLAAGQAAEAEAAFKKAIELAPKALEGHLALASLYMSTGRKSDAEQSFLAALALDPSDARANRAMASFSLATGRIAEAEQYLKQLANDRASVTGVFPLTEYVATGRPKEAIVILEKLAGDSPEGNEARERLARAYAAAGDRAKAVSLTDQALKWDPRSSRAHLFKSQLLAEKGSRDEAISILREVTLTDPNSVDAQFMLGRLYAANGDTQAAEKSFREVLRLNPRAAAAQLELSRLQRTTGRAEASVQTAEAAAQNLPQNPDVRLALVRSLLAANDLKRAETELAKLTAAYPDAPAVLVQAGVLAAARKDVVGARPKFERALALAPDSLEALTGLVLLDLTARDFAKAKERIRGQLAAGKKPSSAMLMLAARTYFAAGEFEPAEQSLRQAIDAEPTLLTAYGMLGQIYLKQRKLDQARLEFDKLAQRQSNPVGALTMSGMILQSQGNKAEARKRYEQAVAKDSRAGVAANNLALLYLDSGENLDIALQFAQTAVSSMPEVAEAQDTLGWIYYKKNLPAQAVPPLARSVEKQPKNPIYHYHLGLAQIQASNLTAGRQSLERALQLDPSFPGSEDARRAIAASPR